jgi:hypothetical protein
MIKVIIDRQLLIFDVSSSSYILNVCFSEVQEHALGSFLPSGTKSASLVLQPLSGMTKYRNAEQGKCAYKDPSRVFIANAFLLCKKSLATVLVASCQKSREFSLARCSLSLMLKVKLSRCQDVEKSTGLPLIITARSNDYDIGQGRARGGNPADNECQASVKQAL